jgi:type IV secretion system protein VirB11
MNFGEKTLLFYLRPFAEHLKTRGVNEIVVNELGEFGVERNGQWHWIPCEEIYYEALDAIGLLAAGNMNKQFDPAHPVCSTVLPGGERLTIIQPPATAPGTMSMTIRIPSQSEPRIEDEDFKTLMQATEISSHQHEPVDKELKALHKARIWPEFFKLALISKKTIGVTGSNKSGKTTFLRRLMRSLPSYERLVTIEDTAEFRELPLKNRVSLFFGAADVTAEMLIETTLRMAASRIAMQELRGKEAYAFLRLQAAGQPGSLTTWHADVNEPFLPLKMMIKQHEAGRHIPDPVLDTMLKSFVDIVVHCKRQERADGPPLFTVPHVYFRHADEQASDHPPIIMPEEETELL